jgi:hypothetical protein
MKVALILLGLVITLLLFAWLGLKVKPAAFPLVSQPQPELSTLPLPSGLPAPVERYYRALFLAWMGRIMPPLLQNGTRINAKNYENA